MKYKKVAEQLGSKVQSVRQSRIWHGHC